MGTQLKLLEDIQKNKNRGEAIFMNNIVEEAISKIQELEENVPEDKDFWVRRASAVVLIPTILKNDYDGIHLLKISDGLLLDEHEVIETNAYNIRCFENL